MSEPAANLAPAEAASLKDLSPTQWRSGIAAWLGWMFDGLDMHLYTMVATAFVAQLLHSSSNDAPEVKYYSGVIQAAFLVGWAVGGGFFGMIGDRLGRSRALALTILTYAIFTGLSFFATAWWHLLIFRFLAALGIGGEWAVGASLLAETWPRAWRPWLAAVLQTGVNVGVLFACALVLALGNIPERYVFLIGVLPAFMVFWIRRQVPESAEWEHAARQQAKPPSVVDLFAPSLRRLTSLTIAVCAMSLTAHWAFMFWHVQHLKTLWTPGSGFATTTALGSVVLAIVMFSSIVGNFAAGAVARFTGYRTAVVVFCLCYAAALFGVYGTPRTLSQMLWLLSFVGFSQGLFALFTMYLPSLFPTLLRTTGAGFCYNIGRIAAGVGTVVFGVAAVSVDYGTALFWTGTLFLPAAGVACFLPEPRAHDPA